MDTFTHGLRSSYTHYGCRCPRCTEAQRLYMIDYTERIRARDMPPQLHGTRNGYSNYGCRCPRCTEANTATCRENARKRKEKAAQSV